MVGVATQTETSGVPLAAQPSVFFGARKQQWTGPHGVSLVSLPWKVRRLRHHPLQGPLTPTHTIADNAPHEQAVCQD